MKKIKPISSMTTPRFADISTFFRLPVIKDLSEILIMLFVEFLGMEVQQIDLGQDMAQEK